MRSRRFPLFSATGSNAALTALLLLSVLSGCAVVGPKAVMSGRMAYNQAISETDNQQMLTVFVNNRYEETNHLLAVANVTANVTLTSSAQVEAGIGDSDDFAGNLVPFRGGFVYEENPTISYTPVQGESYVNQVLNPLPVPVVMPIIHSLPHPEFAYFMLIASLNGIRNPAFLHGQQEPDPRFDRLVSLLTALGHSGCLQWTANSAAPRGITLEIAGEPACIEPADELLTLAGLEQRSRRGQTITLPVISGPSPGSPGGMIVKTRTIFDLVEIMSAAVEAPPEHEASGAVSATPRPGRVGQDLRIRFSDSEPESAYVAIEKDNYWFFIENDDLSTKRYFKLLSSLWSVAMAKAQEGKRSAPVLTVPVSK